MIFSAAALAGLALEYGPSIVRTIGGMMGGKAKEGADKVAKVAEAVKGMDAGLAKKKIVEEVERMDPETLKAMQGFQVEMERIKGERHKATLEADTAQHKQFHETVQTESKSEDPLVRRTRPMLAITSYLSTAWYIMFHTAPSWEMATVLAGPVVVYITGRSVEKVKGKAGPMMGLGSLLPGKKP